MDLIKNYIAICTGFIFVASVIQTLLPEGTMKKSLRMVLGFILSILLITPFVGSKFENVDIFTGSNEYTIYSERISEMEDLKKQQTNNLFTSGIADIVKEFLKGNGAGEASVEVVATDEYKLQKIIINKNVPSLKAKLAQNLGISEEQIQMTE